MTAFTVIATVLMTLLGIIPTNAQWLAATTTSTSTSTTTITMSQVTVTTSIGDHPNAAILATSATKSLYEHKVQPHSEVDDICFPRNTTTGHYDLNYPCPIAYYIMQECIYGREVAQRILNGMPLRTFPVKASPSAKKAMRNSPKYQQLCACNSHMIDFWVGCAECYTAHGAHVVHAQEVKVAGQSYCAPDSTPTLDIVQAARRAIRGMMPIHDQSTMDPDPLSGSTAVSLYFTPPVSGSAATHVPDVTNAAGSTTLSLTPFSSKATAAAEVLGNLTTPCTVSSTTSASNATISTHSTPSASVDANNESSQHRAAIAVVFGFAALVVFL